MTFCNNNAFVRLNTAFKFQFNFNSKSESLHISKGSFTILFLKI